MEQRVERISYVIHRDRRVLLLDFTNCEPDEVAALADQVPAIVMQEPAGSVLAVADFTGAEFDKDAVERIKIATAFDRPHVSRAAWVLTENLPKALYDSIRRFSARDFPVFHTREEALDYVAE
jgi:hypothetical protein